MFSKFAYSIFEKSIADYHITDDVNQSINNPFPKDQIEQEIWLPTEEYYFKKAHAIAYAVSIVVQLNLLVEKINIA